MRLERAPSAVITVDTPDDVMRLEALAKAALVELDRRIEAGDSAARHIVATAHFILENLSPPEGGEERPQTKKQPQPPLGAT